MIRIAILSAMITVIALTGCVSSKDSIHVYLDGELLNDVVYMYNRGLLFEEIDAFLTSRIADELLTLIRPLFSKEGHVVPYKSTNTLIMTDLKSNLYRILKIINELDVKGYHAELYVLPLRYASVKTVTDHLTNILGKLGVRDRTQAALKAKEFGLI